MKKFYAIVILIAFGITQIYAQNCFNCEPTTKAFSIGASAATGNNSFAGGNESVTTAENSFVFGDNSFVTHSGGIAFGKNANSYAANSYVFGQYLTSSGYNSITIGMGTSFLDLINNKPNSIMFGVNQFPSLTIVKPDSAALGYVGIGTDEPKEMAHVVGKLLIDRTNNVASSLQFKHPATRGESGGGGFQPFIPQYYWDIYSDVYGLKFNTITNDSTSTQRMIISNNGRVGIGVASPAARLHVDQNILANGSITTLNKFVLTPEYDSNSEYWEISRTNTGLNYAYNDRIFENVLFMGNDGLIGIGTTTPSSRLDVNGSFSAQTASINGLLCAREIRVRNTPCWPDFVFVKEYKLLPLNEVEQFIAENHHLPNVPSAAEVEANGIELGEMNAILLQKVEELTLYIIQMEKRLAEVEKQMVND